MYYKIITGMAENIIVRTEDVSGKVLCAVEESDAATIDSALYNKDDWDEDLQPIVDSGEQVEDVTEAITKLVVAQLNSITPLPWKYEDDYLRGANGVIVGDLAPDSMVSIRTGEQFANSDFIVKAVNSHNDLVDMVANTKAMLESNDYDGDRIEATIANMNNLLEGLK